MILVHGTKNHLMKNNMNIKIVKTVTIISWLFLVLHIVLPFIGVITRNWMDTSLWTVLSIVWTTIWMDNLEKIIIKTMGSLTIALLILVVISNMFMAIVYYELSPLTVRPIKWLLFIPPLAWIPVIISIVISAIESIKRNLGK